MMRRIRQHLLATSILLLSACSNLPQRGFPAQLDYEVQALYEFSELTPSAVEVPASRPDLTVFELDTEPGELRESFREGKRFLLIPEGCRELRLRCRYRVYGHVEGGRDLSSPERIFPGATSLSIR